MAIRLRRFGHNVVVGSGSLAGLLLGWSGTSTLCAQPWTATPPAVQKVARQADAPTAVQPADTPESAPAQRNFLNKKVIQLPIQIEASARASIQEIQLFVKERADSPWVLRDKVGPAQTAFLFQATNDGEYWFTMATVDKQGRCFPPDLRKEPPGLIVVIDTQKPVVELTNLGTVPEGQLIQCEVRDANLDTAKSRFSYQGGDKVFRSLEPVPGRANVYCIPVQAVCSGLVRASAEDLAGNQIVLEEQLSKLQAHVTPSVTPVTKTPILSDPPNTLPPSLTTLPVIPPADVPLKQLPIKDPVERTSFRPNGSEGPRFQDNSAGDSTPVIAPPPAPMITQPQVPASAPAIANLPANRQIVNNTKVFLDYEIENTGSSDVGKIAVWVTRDQGQTWQKLSEDTQRKGPVEVNLPGEGLFGLTLVAGAAAPPAAKDAPDWWIEVDTTKPAVQITGVQTVHDKGETFVHIRWAAQDKNLGDTPVDLFYATTPQGPWQPVAKGLKAQGEHRWTPPAGLGAHAHLQLVVRDTAGNTSVCGTLEPVVLQEQGRPRAVIRSVRTGN